MVVRKGLEPPTSGRHLPKQTTCASALPTELPHQNKGVSPSSLIPYSPQTKIMWNHEQNILPLLKILHSPCLKVFLQTQHFCIKNSFSCFLGKEAGGATDDFSSTLLVGRFREPSRLSTLSTVGYLYLNNTPPS